MATMEYRTVSPAGDDRQPGYPLVICLHGYGACMDDLIGLAPALDGNAYRYVFPNAPLAAFDGADPTQRAWYERGGDESAAAVQEATAHVDRLLDEVRARFAVPSGRIVLLGFSQGGAMALRCGLPRPEMFAGVAVLSGSLRKVDDLRPGLPARRDQPIFIGHGTADGMVPIDCARRLQSFLISEGYQPFYRTYPIDHQISPAEVRDLRGWLRKTLPLP